MSSASSDSWSQADLETLSIPSSPMSISSSVDLPGTPDSARALDDPIGANTLDNKPESLSQDTGFPLLDALDGSSLKRSKYYMSDEDIFTAIVEDTVFRLHAFYFKQLLETHLKASPLVLPETKARDLEAFLDLLYPHEFGAESYTGKTVDEWMGILRFAHRWGFRSIHKLALQHVERVASPIDKVVCARTLGAADWLVGAYTAVCTRVEPLTLDEGMKLGMAALYERKDMLAPEEILRVGMKEVTCINTMRENVRALKKGKDVATLVEKKLVDYEILLMAQDAQSQPGHVSSGAVPTYEPIYKPPRLDIREASGRSVLGGDLDSDINWKLKKSGPISFSLRRKGNKLFVETIPNGGLFINGVLHCRGDSGKELLHGDVIALRDNHMPPLTNGLDRLILGTGYLVCKEGSAVASAQWPTVGPHAMKTADRRRFRQQEARSWTSAICEAESNLVAFELMHRMCLEQEHETEQIRQIIHNAVETLRSPVANMMRVAQLRAQDPSSEDYLEQ